MSDCLQGLGDRPIRPSKLRLEAASVCQLRCPTCPTAAGTIAQQLGASLLDPGRFQQLLDDNPWVRAVELSNWGELFLHPQLLGIMEIAHARQVELSADNGTNFNHVSDEVLAGLVRFQFRRLNCSIDGVTQEVYQHYRRRGVLSQVLGNIQKLNAIKAAHGSQYPELRWQFIAFEHNLHEVELARCKAAKLGMKFFLKLSWEDLYDEIPFSPVTNLDLLRRLQPQGVASRGEFELEVGKPYAQGVCRQLWEQPQIHSDGRMLGCCLNTRVSYGNVFSEGLEKVINGQQLTYARKMLLGDSEPRADIYCTGCSVYQAMRATGRYLEDCEGGLLSS